MKNNFEITKTDWELLLGIYVDLYGMDRSVDVEYPRSSTLGTVDPLFAALSDHIYPLSLQPEAPTPQSSRELRELVRSSVKSSHYHYFKNLIQAQVEGTETMLSAPLSDLTNDIDNSRLLNSEYDPSVAVLRLDTQDEHSASWEVDMLRPKRSSYVIALWRLKIGK